MLTSNKQQNKMTLQEQIKLTGLNQSEILKKLNSKLGEDIKEDMFSHMIKGRRKISETRQKTLENIINKAIKDNLKRLNKAIENIELSK